MRIPSRTGATITTRAWLCVALAAPFGIACSTLGIGDREAPLRGSGPDGGGTGYGGAGAGALPDEPGAALGTGLASGAGAPAEGQTGSSGWLGSGPVSGTGNAASRDAGSGRDGSVAEGPADCSEPLEPSLPALRLTLVADGLEEPVYVTAAPGDDARLFVVEKPGRVRLIAGGELRAEPFLDITDRVASNVEEMGLLGLAFHPNYRNNRLLYVRYSIDPQPGTNPAHTELLAEYVANTDDPDHAEAHERRILGVAKPEGNHNGGNLQFGPDGFLYIGMGDGGGGRDQHGSIGNGQALDTLLGKLLRLDVDGRGAGPEGQYAVPAGNFSEREPLALPEIWSLGLRNPWRFSFDACTGDLYIGDVGQEAREEVDFQPAGAAAGANYGWRLMEAENCFEPETECDPGVEGLTLPVASYGRDAGQAITGGYVYRGLALPALRGAYLYADYESAAFFALRLGGGGVAVAPVDITEELNPGRATGHVASFGQDNAGELYVVSFDGQVLRIDPE